MSSSTYSLRESGSSRVVRPDITYPRFLVRVWVTYGERRFRAALHDATRPYRQQYCDHLHKSERMALACGDRMVADILKLEQGRAA